MAGDSHSDSSNYGDEVDYDPEDNDYQDDHGSSGDEGHQDREEEDEEFGEFGEVGEASVIQSELGSGSDRDLASPRTPHGAGYGSHGMGFDHSRTSSINSIPMSEGIGHIPPSEYGSQFDGESTYGGRGYGYGGHSRQLSGVSIDDRISYVPNSAWGNVEEEDDETEQDQQQQQRYEGDGEEDEEELKGPGGRPLSGYFPGAGRYDGEYDDDREYGEEDDEEGDGYADEDEGMEHGDEGSEEGSEVDENEELTEIIEQLRPYMMLSGTSQSTGRISA